MPISLQLPWLRDYPQHRPRLLRYRSSTWFIVLTIFTAIFTDVFLYTVIVPVIPFALESRANIQPGQVQSWVSILIAVYGGALAAFSPISGWFADRIASRRMTLLLGLIALAGATVMLNVGRSIAVLAVGRCLQGISAAVVWTVGLALMADSAGNEQMAQMMGLVFIGMNLGVFLGPLLGGVVFAAAGYNWVFGMTYILIGVDIAMRLLVVEKKVAQKWINNEDQPVVTALNEGEAAGGKLRIDQKEDNSMKLTFQQQGDAIQLAPREASPTLATAIPLEAKPVQNLAPRKKKLPAIITLLKSRRLLTALWGTIVAATLMTQFDSVLPIHVRHAFNWDSTGAGLIFLPISIPSFVSPVIGWLCDRYGYRWFATAGLVLFAPFELLLRLITHDSLGQKVLLCALLFFLGLTFTMFMTPLMAEISLVVANKEKETPGLFGHKGAYAQAYGLFNLAWAVGSLVGPIWAGFVSEHAGWGTMTLTLAALSLVSAIPAAIWIGGSIFKKKKSDSGGNGDAENVNAPNSRSNAV